MRVILAVALLVAAADPAPALTLLTSQKTAVFRGGKGAIVRVGPDRVFRTLRNPTCPTVSSVRFALSRTGANFEDHGEVALPRAAWRPHKEGFQYRASDGGPGGIREIRYTHRGLVIRAEGSSWVPVTGPVAYVEAWLTLDGERHLVRFQNFDRNDAERIATRRPSAPAPAPPPARPPPPRARRPSGIHSGPTSRGATRRSASSRRPCAAIRTTAGRSSSSGCSISTAARRPVPNSTSCTSATRRSPRASRPVPVPPWGA